MTGRKGKASEGKGRKSLWHINQTFNLGWKCLAKLLPSRHMNTRSHAHTHGGKDESAAAPAAGEEKRDIMERREGETQ